MTSVVSIAGNRARLWYMIHACLYCWRKLEILPDTLVRDRESHVMYLISHIWLVRYITRLYQSLTKVVRWRSTIRITELWVSNKAQLFETSGSMTERSSRGHYKYVLWFTLLQPCKYLSWSVALWLIRRFWLCDRSCAKLRESPLIVCSFSLWSWACAQTASSTIYS